MRTLWAIILTARHGVSHWYNTAMVPKKVVNCSVTDLKTHPDKRPFMPNIVNLIQNSWLKRSEGMLFRWINIALARLLKAALSIHNRSLSLRCIEVNAKIQGYTTSWEWSTVDGSALIQTLTLLPWGPRIISEDEIEQKRQKMGDRGCKVLLPKHDMITAIKNSQPICLLTLDPHSLSSPNNQKRMDKGLMSLITYTWSVGN